MATETQALVHPSQIASANEALVKSFPVMLQLGKTLLDSGFLPQSIKSPAQALAIILRGQELSMGPMEALCTLQVIQGKVVIPPEVMLRQARQKGGVIAEVLDSTEESCSIKFTRPGQPAHTETFTIEDARRLGIADKDNYRKQPRVMLRWRCIGAGLRFYASDCFGGPVYGPQEIEEIREAADVEQLDKPEPTLARGEEPVIDAETVESKPEVKTEPQSEQTLQDRFVTALKAERARVGDEQFFAIAGFTGLDSFDDIAGVTDLAKQVEIIKALKALNPATKTTKLKERIKSAPEPVAQATF